MKTTDKNILMITAGGVGNRFGANVPKQYLMLNGRMVIDYVIDACLASKKADSVLLLADPKYHELLSGRGVTLAESGPDLNHTKRMGFDYIKSHCDAEKVVVVDAVRPSVETETLDRLFDLLDIHDAAACARPITDSLGRRGHWHVDRSEYYTLNAPEGFRFPLLDRYFRADCILTESVQQLPENADVCLVFDIPYYDKITFPEDLVRAEATMLYRQHLKERK